MSPTARWGLLATSHPGPSAIVSLTALGLAIAADADGVDVVLITAAVAAGQLSIGWSNDWLDAARGWDRARADKPVDRGTVSLASVRTAARAAVIACAVLSASLGWRAAIIHLVAVAGGWSYNAWLKATPLSPVPYLISFGLLPSVVTATVGAGLAPTWATVTGACFGAGVHVANVLPDLDTDARSGVRGLPQRLGAAASVWATVALLGGGAATVLLAPAGVALTGALTLAGGVVVAALVVALAVTGLTGHHRLAYRLAMATGLVVVGLLVLRGDALAAGA